MSANCVRCVKNKRTGHDLLCDACRQQARADNLPQVDACWIVAQSNADMDAWLCTAGWHLEPEGMYPIVCSLQQMLAGQKPGTDMPWTVLPDLPSLGKFTELKGISDSLLETMGEGIVFPALGFRSVPAGKTGMPTVLTIDGPLLTKMLAMTEALAAQSLTA